jgi:hypothetical protein
VLANSCTISGCTSCAASTNTCCSRRLLSIRRMPCARVADQNPLRSQQAQSLQAAKSRHFKPTGLSACMPALACCMLRLRQGLNHAVRRADNQSCRWDYGTAWCVCEHANIYVDAIFQCIC